MMHLKHYSLENYNTKCFHLYIHSFYNKLLSSIYVFLIMHLFIHVHYNYCDKNMYITITKCPNPTILFLSFCKIFERIYKLVANQGKEILTL